MTTTRTTKAARAGRRSSRPAPGRDPLTAARGAGRRASAAAMLAVVGAAAMALLAGAASAAHSAAHTERARQQEETLRKTFTLSPAPGGGRTVEVDNFSGAVVVRGRPGDEVTLAVHETWAADSDEKLALARREVRLDVVETGGRLRFFVDGPFRSRDGGICFHGWDRLGYDARFDFELEVPADVDLVARTVNDGEVRATGIGGRFDVSNVNGPVTLERLGGAGKARSVNGAVAASFVRNPTAACTFETVNGRVEASFLPDLAADLRLKTLNGEIFTDYDYTWRNLPPQPADRSRGRFHYRSHGEVGARIAGGGPELSFSTINGDILIRRQGA